MLTRLGGIRALPTFSAFSLTIFNSSTLQSHQTFLRTPLSFLPSHAIPLPFSLHPTVSYSSFRPLQLETSCLYLRTGVSEVYPCVLDWWPSPPVFSHNSLSFFMLALTPLHCHCPFPCLTSPLCCESCEGRDQLYFGHHSIPRACPKDIGWIQEHVKMFNVSVLLIWFLALLLRYLTFLQADKLLKALKAHLKQEARKENENQVWFSIFFITYLIAK